MTERTNQWREIFGELVEDNGYYEMMKVNVYKLTSHLEELYLRIDELEEKLKNE